MFFIGDVHGKVPEYLKIIKDLDSSIQVGDFGLGFRGVPTAPWDINHKFIRGNHDSPQVCREHPNYLGDFGVTPEGIFFVGGAFSIDYKWRHTWNYSHPNQPVWWEDEEIAEDQFPSVLEYYNKVKPTVVVAHDAPSFVKAFIVDGNIEDKRRYINRTSDGLMPEMIESHRPALWVFGHYHTSTDVVIDNVRYVGLDELEVFKYEGVGAI